MADFENERFELVAERIAALASENEAGGSLADYFAASASYINDVLTYRESLRAHPLPADFVDDGADEAALAARQQKLYAPVLPENYENSYANPAYAHRMLGSELGGLLSMLFADLTALVPWAAQGRDDLILILLELFCEIYGCVTAEGESSPESLSDETCRIIAGRISDAIYWFYHDYSEIFTAEAITEMVGQTDGFFHRLIADADLSDPRYLYAYGYFVTDNERRLSSYMSGLSEEAVQRMADTFTEGYRIGFEVTRKDITKKKTVRIDYPLGMERMVRLAVANFEKIGLKPTFMSTPLLSAQGRGRGGRAVFSCAANRQFYYDHKDDSGFYSDARYLNRRLEVMRDTYEALEKEARAFGGPAVIEMFGEEKFEPKNKPENRVFTKEQNEQNVRFANESGMLRDKYIPGDEYSFTIISYPYPSIGGEFERIFDEVVKINTLDYMKYRRIQQHLIDALDCGEWVEVRGAHGNVTDMRVALHPLTDPEAQTKFENCVADVNIPVGEVFTTPVLEGTDGTLFVSEVYLGDYFFKNLKLSFKDGYVTDYTCENFDSEEENRRLIYDNILFAHETLPIGEFAIGTNTAAYRMAKEFGIFDRLPILIAEKTGPHFAVGDSCYSHAEEVAMYNPDGKEVIARDNSRSLLRKTKPEEAYFNCHTDITIPFEELAEITVVAADGSRYPLIKDGLFVAEGTGELNEALL